MVILHRSNIIPDGATRLAKDTIPANFAAVSQRGRIWDYETMALYTEGDWFRDDRSVRLLQVSSMGFGAF